MAPTEKSPLLYFYGVECSHCDLMDPLIKQLEEETGMTLRKFEVWYNDDNQRLLQRLDKDGLCNGVPFFYSKIKRDWICGATIYPNFKAWALGKPHDRFLAPPTEESEVMGQFKGIFDKIKTEGFQKMRERMEAGKKRAGEMPGAGGKQTTKAGAFVAPRAESDAPRTSSAFDAYSGVLMPSLRGNKCASRAPQS
jgi:thiol-disulfide isomerase/thioredoxin